MAVKLQPPPNTESILLFDGVCNLCDGFVNFVADGDSKRNVKFAAQQKHMDLLRRVGAPTDLSTLVLVQGDKFYTHSSAVIRTFAVMDPWPYHSLLLMELIPRFFRDFFYRIVANHRYMIFGKRDECRIPTEGFKARFLDGHVSDLDSTDHLDGHVSDLDSTDHLDEHVSDLHPSDHILHLHAINGDFMDTDDHLVRHISSRGVGGFADAAVKAMFGSSFFILEVQRLATLVEPIDGDYEHGGIVSIYCEENLVSYSMKVSVHRDGSEYVVTRLEHSGHISDLEERMAFEHKFHQPNVFDWVEGIPDPGNYKHDSSEL
eukprot:g4356.t1